MNRFTDHRNHADYITMAIRHADLELARGNETEALKHRKIALAVMLRSVQDMTAVTSTSIGRLAEFVPDDITPHALKDIQTTAELVGKYPPQNDLALFAYWRGEQNGSPAAQLIAGDLAYTIDHQDAPHGHDVTIAAVGRVALARQSTHYDKTVPLFGIRLAAMTHHIMATTTVHPPQFIKVAPIAAIAGAAGAIGEQLHLQDIDWQSRYSAQRTM